MKAKCEDGNIFVHRSTDENIVNDLHSLLEIYKIAKEERVYPPVKQYIFVCGLDFTDGLSKELDKFRWFKNTIATHYDSFLDLWWDNKNSFDYYDYPAMRFVLDIYASNQDSDFSILYSLLCPDEFEHFVTYMLTESEGGRFVPSEDYTMDMFIEHEKKRRASYK